jgi:hypothetical protein
MNGTEMRRVVEIGIGIILVVGNSVMRSPSRQFSPELSSCFIFGSGFILIWHQDEALARSHQPAPAARWLPTGDVAEQGKRSGPPALRSVEGKNAYSRYCQF